MGKKPGRPPKQRLRKEESEILKKLLEEKEIDIEKLAKNFRISKKTFTRFTNGEAPVSSFFAESLYNYFGKDPGLAFLQNYFNELTKYPECPFVDSWANLFREYTSKLYIIYATHPPEIKGKILGGLEKLSNEFKSEKE